jgi:hypothetical protein
MPFSFYAVFPPDAVTIAGQVDVFASSEHGRRYFCPACGSQVYSHDSRPDEIYVYPGSFDETGLWEPTYELWTIRRDKWLPAFPSVVNRYEKDRPKWSRMSLMTHPRRLCLGCRRLRGADPGRHFVASTAARTGTTSSAARMPD